MSNSLPNDVVEADAINTFKNRLELLINIGLIKMFFLIVTST